MTDHDRKTIEACERLKNKMSLMDEETSKDVITVISAWTVTIQCWDMMLNAMSGNKQPAGGAQHRQRGAVNPNGSLPADHAE